jgi:PAS domain S-box-containing protein
MLDVLKGAPEEALGIVERELRSGFWTWTLRTNEMQWSRGYHDLLGIEPGAVKPSFGAILQVTHPEDRGAQADVERIIKMASSIRRKFRVIRRGGNIVWIYCQIIIFVDSDGGAEKALGICTDITAREDELNALRVSGERYHALLKATGGVVWIKRSDGRIHEVVNCEHSHEFQTMSLNTGWLELIHPDDREKTLRAWDDAAREKRIYDVVHRIRRADGSFKWKRSTGQPVLDASGNIKEWLGVTLEIERETTRAEGHRITGAQIRAARGLLRWSVMDLANAAGITRATIRRIEELDSAPSQSDPALPAIESALFKAGVEFCFPAAGKPGVRPR